MMGESKRGKTAAREGESGVVEDNLLVRNGDDSFPMSVFPLLSYLRYIH